MSDKAKDTTKEKKTDAAATGDKKAKAAKTVVAKKAKEVTKVVWTLERCQKFARRFPTEQVWAATHSSSYKSATAHGWIAACVAELGKNTGGKVFTPNFKKPTSPETTTGKKAA
jgi:hypothetical protein